MAAAHHRLVEQTPIDFAHLNVEIAVSGAHLRFASLADSVATNRQLLSSHALDSTVAPHLLVPEDGFYSEMNETRCLRYVCPAERDHLSSSRMRLQRHILDSIRD